MDTKDWILLFIPIIFNGIIIFILEKTFEKKQIVRAVKFEYISEMTKKIDIPLSLYAKSRRLSSENNRNNDEIVNKVLEEFVHSVLDVNEYYEQNKNIFDSAQQYFQNIEKLNIDLTTYANNLKHDFETNIVYFQQTYNELRNALLEAKNLCMNFEI